MFGPTRTLEKGELLEEPRSHKRVCETEEQAAEEQPSGADVDGVRLGTGETHRRLQEPTRDLVPSEAAPRTALNLNSTTANGNTYILKKKKRSHEVFYSDVLMWMFMAKV